MDDTPHTGQLPSGEESGGALDPGLPVGLAASAGATPYPAASPAPSPTPSWVVPMILLALVAGLGIGLAIGLLVGGNDGSGQAATTTTAAGPTTTAGDPTTTLPWETADAYGATVTVAGNPLPMLGSAATDTAVGLPLPEITGTDFAGNALTIAADGKAKLIVALAHWCPYCNAEVPILMDWYPAGVPDGVEVITLSVYSDPAKANFPPATWLRQAEWDLPLLADDEGRTLVTALGIPAVPFWLLVSADGTVIERGTGQVEAATLDQIVEALAATAEGATTTVP
ncbi:MAG: TlpA disulfide reductase family protein [Actinomycetota bacterium]